MIVPLDSSAASSVKPVTPDNAAIATKEYVPPKPSRSTNTLLLPALSVIQTKSVIASVNGS
jgi:hypothetical protein